MIQFWIQKYNRRWLALTGWLVALSFIFTTISAPFAQANLWSERKKAAEELKVRNSGIPSQKYSDDRIKDKLEPWMELASSVGLPMGQSPSLLGMKPQLSPEIIKQVMSKIKTRQQNKSRKKSQIQLTLPSELLARIDSYGSIEKVHLVKGDHLKIKAGKLQIVSHSSPLVIFIQDAHGISTVQKNIAHLLKELTEMGVGLVGVEGSSGKLEGLEKWRSYQDKESLMGAAGYLLEKGLLTGMEVAGLSSKNVEYQYTELRGIESGHGDNAGSAVNRTGVEYYGVEDKEKYLEQVKSFKDTLKNENRVQDWVLGIGKKIKELKQLFYTVELKELDENKEGYEKGEKKLGQWIEFLSNKYGETNLQFPNISKYLNAYHLEKEINFKKVSEEQKQLLEELSKRLSKEELMGLLEESLLYRLGRIEYRDFYEGIQERCKNAKVQITPELSKYIQYVVGVEGIDQGKLFIEGKELEEKVIARLTNDERNQTIRQNIDLRQLVELDKDFHLLEKALDFRLSPEEWEEYSKREGEIKRIGQRIDEWSNSGSQINRETKIGFKDGIKNEGLTGLSQAVEELLKNASKFNRLSHERNHIFVDKILSKFNEHLEQNFLPPPQMRKSQIANLKNQALMSDNNISLLVAGGYHSKGIEQILRDKNISYIIIRPHMNLQELNETGVENRAGIRGQLKQEYHPLNVFRKNVLPLEKMFLPEKVSLAPEPNLGGINPLVTNGEAIVESALAVMTEGLKEIKKMEGIEKGELERFEELEGSKLEEKKGNQEDSSSIYSVKVMHKNRTYKFWTPKKDDKALNQVIVKNPEEALEALKSFKKRKIERIESGEIWNIFDKSDKKRGFAFALEKRGVAERVLIPVSKVLKGSAQESSLFLKIRGQRFFKFVIHDLGPRLKRFGLMVVASSLAAMGIVGVGGGSGGAGGIGDHSKNYIETILKKYKLFPTQQYLFDTGIYGAGLYSFIDKFSKPAKWSLFDLSGDSQVLSVPYEQHAKAIKEVINPINDSSLVGLYAGAGADFSSFLLSTNIQRAYFVDLSRVDANKLLRAIEIEWDKISFDDPYTNYKKKSGFAAASTMPDIHKRIVQELKGLGVQKETIKISEDEGETTIIFLWSYPGSGVKRKYTVTYINADITLIKEKGIYRYLHKVLESGIDIYYQRAGMSIAKAYSEFLARIGTALRVGGYLVTDDTPNSGHLTYPREWLMMSGSEFSRTILTEEMRSWIRFIKRHNSCDYGWNVTIRKKEKDFNSIQDKKDRIISILAKKKTFAHVLFLGIGALLLFSAFGLVSSPADAATLLGNDYPVIFTWNDLFKIINPLNFSGGTIARSFLKELMIISWYGGWMWIWTMLKISGGYRERLAKSLSKVRRIRFSFLARSAISESEDESVTRTASWPIVLSSLSSWIGTFSSIRNFTWRLAGRNLFRNKRILDFSRILQRNAMPLEYDQKKVQDNNFSQKYLQILRRLQEVLKLHKLEFVFHGNKVFHDEHLNPHLYTSEEVHPSNPPIISKNNYFKNTIGNLQSQAHHVFGLIFRLFVPGRFGYSIPDKWKRFGLMVVASSLAVMGIVGMGSNAGVGGVEIGGAGEGGGGSGGVGINPQAESLIKEIDDFLKKYPEMEQAFGRAYILEHWRILSSFQESAGDKVWYVYKYGLPTFKKLISNPESLQKVGSILARFAFSAGANTDYLFTLGLLTLEPKISTIEELESVGSDLIDLGIKADHYSWYMYLGILPALIESLTPQNLKWAVTLALSEVEQEWGDIEDSFWSKIQPLAEAFGDAWVFKNLKTLRMIHDEFKEHSGIIFRTLLTAFKELIQTTEDLETFVIYLRPLADNVSPRYYSDPNIFLFETIVYYKPIIKSLEDFKVTALILKNLNIKAGPSLRKSLLQSALPSLFGRAIHTIPDIYKVGIYIIHVFGPKTFFPVRVSSFEAILKHGLPNFRTLITSLRTLRTVLILLAGFDQEVKNAFLFQDALSALQPIIKNRGQLKIAGSHLTQASELLKKVDQGDFFKHGIPNIAHLILKVQDIKSVSSILVEIIKSAAALTPIIFEFGLFFFKHLVVSKKSLRELGEILNEIAKKSGKNANIVFEFGFRAFYEKIQSLNDLKIIGNDLADFANRAEESAGNILMFIFPSLDKVYGKDWVYEHWPLLKTHLFKIFSCTSDYNRVAVVHLLFSYSHLELLKNNGVDLWNHLDFYSSILKQEKRLGYQLLDGIVEGMRPMIGAVELSLPEEEKKRILEFINETRVFSPYLYGLYKAEGKSALKEVIQFSQMILTDSVGKREVEEFIEKFNSRGFHGTEILMAAIQMVIPSSGASFVSRDEIRDLLESFLEIGDLRGAHIPENLRDKDFGGGESDALKIEEWVLKSSEQFDPDGRIAQTLNQLRFKEREIAEDVKKEKQDQDRKKLKEALIEFLSQKERSPAEKQKVLDAFYAFASHNDQVGEKVDRIQPDDYAGLYLLEQLFGDKDNLASFIVPVIEEVLKENPEFTRGQSSEQISNFVDHLWRKNLFRLPLSLIQAEKRKFIKKETDKKVVLEFRVVKGIPYGLWGLNAGVCNADDLELWKNPNFLLVAMSDKVSGQVVGFMNLLKAEVDGEKVLVVPEINPSVEFLSEVNSRDLYPLIEKALLGIAQEGEYDALYFAKEESMLSNRPEIYKEVLKRHKGKIKKLVFPIEWNHIPQPYPIEEVFEVWRSEKSKRRWEATAAIKRYLNYLKGAYAAEDRIKETNQIKSWAQEYPIGNAGWHTDILDVVTSNINRWVKLIIEILDKNRDDLIWQEVTGYEIPFGTVGLGIGNVPSTVIAVGKLPMNRSVSAVSLEGKLKIEVQKNEQEVKLKIFGRSNKNRWKLLETRAVEDVQFIPVEGTSAYVTVRWNKVFIKELGLFAIINQREGVRLDSGMRFNRFDLPLSFLKLKFPDHYGDFDQKQPQLLDESGALGGFMFWVRDWVLPRLAQLWGLSFLYKYTDPEKYERNAWRIENSLFILFLGVPSFILFYLFTGHDLLFAFRTANLITWSAFLLGHTPMVAGIFGSRAPPGNFWRASIISLISIYVGFGLFPSTLHSYPYLFLISIPAVLMISYFVHFIVNILPKIWKMVVVSSAVSILALLSANGIVALLQEITIDSLSESILIEVVTFFASLYGFGYLVFNKIYSRAQKGNETILKVLPWRAHLVSFVVNAFGAVVLLALVLSISPSDLDLIYRTFPKIFSFYTLVAHAVPYVIFYTAGRYQDLFYPPSDEEGDGGGLKRISIGTHPSLKLEDQQELVRLAESGRIVEHEPEEVNGKVIPYNLVKCHAVSEDRIYEILKSYQIEGAYHYIHPLTGKIYVFVQEDFENSDFAMRHELYEIYWKEKLNLPKGSSSQRLYHILAWINQLAKENITSIEQLPFLKQQLEEIQEAIQLAELFYENRGLHRFYRTLAKNKDNFFLPLIKSGILKKEQLENVTLFEESVREYIKQILKKKFGLDSYISDALKWDTLWKIEEPNQLGYSSQLSARVAERGSTGSQTSASVLSSAEKKVKKLKEVQELRARMVNVPSHMQSVQLYQFEDILKVAKKRRGKAKTRTRQAQFSLRETDEQIPRIHQFVAILNNWFDVAYFLHGIELDQISQHTRFKYSFIISKSSGRSPISYESAQILLEVLKELVPEEKEKRVEVELKEGMKIPPARATLMENLEGVIDPAPPIQSANPVPEPVPSQTASEETSAQRGVTAEDILELVTGALKPKDETQTELDSMERFIGDLRRSRYKLRIDEPKKLEQIPDTSPLLKPIDLEQELSKTGLSHEAIDLIRKHSITIYDFLEDVLKTETKGGVVIELSFPRYVMDALVLVSKLSRKKIDRFRTSRRITKKNVEKVLEFFDSIPIELEQPIFFFMGDQLETKYSLLLYLFLQHSERMKNVRFVLGVDRAVQRLYSAPGYLTGGDEIPIWVDIFRDFNLYSREGEHNRKQRLRANDLKRDLHGRLKRGIGRNQRFVSDEEGSARIEFGLIVGLIAVGIVLMIQNPLGAAILTNPICWLVMLYFSRILLFDLLSRFVVPSWFGYSIPVKWKRFSSMVIMGSLAAMGFVGLGGGGGGSSGSFPKRPDQKDFIKRIGDILEAMETAQSSGVASLPQLELGLPEGAENEFLEIAQSVQIAGDLTNDIVGRVAEFVEKHFEEFKGMKIQPDKFREKLNARRKERNRRLETQRLQSAGLIQRQTPALSIQRQIVPSAIHRQAIPADIQPQTLPPDFEEFLVDIDIPKFYIEELKSKPALLKMLLQDPNIARLFSARGAKKTGQKSGAVAQRQTVLTEIEECLLNGGIDVEAVGLLKTALPSLEHLGILIERAIMIGDVNECVARFMERVPLEKSLTIDSVRYRKALKNVVEFSKESESNLFARRFTEIAAEKAAELYYESTRENQQLPHRPSSPNPSDSEKEGSNLYVDLTSGSRFLVYMDSLRDDLNYHLVDSSFFVTVFLNKMVELLGKKNVTVVQEDIALLEYKPGSVGTIHVQNLGNFFIGSSVFWNRVSLWLEEGGQIIFQVDPTALVRDRNFSMVDRLYRDLIEKEGWGFEYKVGVYHKSLSQMSLDTFVFTKPRAGEHLESKQTMEDYLREVQIDMRHSIQPLTVLALRAFHRAFHAMLSFRAAKEFKEDPRMSDIPVLRDVLNIQFNRLLYENSTVHQVVSAHRDLDAETAELYFTADRAALYTASYLYKRVQELSRIASGLLDPQSILDKLMEEMAKTSEIIDRIGIHARDEYGESHFEDVQGVVPSSLFIEMRNIENLLHAALAAGKASGEALNHALAHTKIKLWMTPILLHKRFDLILRHFWDKDSKVQALQAMEGFDRNEPYGPVSYSISLRDLKNELGVRLREEMSDVEPKFNYEYLQTMDSVYDQILKEDEPTLQEEDFANFLVGDALFTQIINLAYLESYSLPQAVSEIQKGIENGEILNNIMANIRAGQIPELFDMREMYGHLQFKLNSYLDKIQNQSPIFLLIEIWTTLRFYENKIAFFMEQSRMAARPAAELPAPLALISEQTRVSQEPAINPSFPSAGIQKQGRDLRVKNLSDQDASNIIARLGQALEMKDTLKFAPIKIGNRTFEVESYYSDKYLMRILRIGPLIFIEAPGHPYKEMNMDTQTLDDRIQFLKSHLGNYYFEHQDNIFFTRPSRYSVAKVSETEYSDQSPIANLLQLSSHTMLAIAAMLAYPEQIENEIFPDYGAGDGLLSRVALRLGASQAILFELDPVEFKRARVFFKEEGRVEANGSSDGDYRILAEDLTSPHFVEKFKNDVRIKNVRIGAANLASPDAYANADQNVIDLILQLSEMKFFISCGHAANYSLHEAYLLKSVGRFEAAGFQVEPYEYYFLEGTNQADFIKSAPKAYNTVKGFIALRPTPTMTATKPKSDVVEQNLLTEARKKITENLTPASLLDHKLRENDFHKRHPILYVIYTVFLSNWEVVYFIPVLNGIVHWILMKAGIVKEDKDDHLLNWWLKGFPVIFIFSLLPPSNIFIAMLSPFFTFWWIWLGAELFSDAHLGRTSAQREVLYKLGLILAGVVMIPILMAWMFLVTLAMSMLSPEDYSTYTEFSPEQFLLGSNIFGIGSFIVIHTLFAIFNLIFKWEYSTHAGSFVDRYDGVEEKLQLKFIEEHYLVLLELEKEAGEHAQALFTKELPLLRELITSDNLKSIGLDLIELRKIAGNRADRYAIDGFYELKKIITPENLKSIGLDLIELEKAVNDTVEEYKEHFFKSFFLDILKEVEVATPKNLQSLGLDLLELWEVVEGSYNYSQSDSPTKKIFLNLVEIFGAEWFHDNWPKLKEFLLKIKSHNNSNNWKNVVSMIFDEKHLKFLKDQNADIIKHLNFYDQILLENSEYLNEILQLIQSREIDTALEDVDLRGIINFLKRFGLWDLRYFRHYKKYSYSKQLLDIWEKTFQD
ncbi:MAG: hypothetical protein HYT97_09860, partial [Elusimicrobia bacterium]|nr:hypothetical protein [Elusimicrobiota bacterium]